jgi:hypothetical protein
MSAAFDGRVFDGISFDIGRTDIRPTIAGWTKRVKSQSTWAPYLSRTVK